MHDRDNFKTFKERGEWVELQFMADAASHGYHVLKPCGDSLEYDVAVEHSGDLIRIQVKSTTARKGYGYLCRLRHGVAGERRYDPENVDLFAIYVIPAKAWYLIPALVVLRPKPKMHIRFYPDGLPRRRRGRHDEAHDYERYREAWHLLSKTPQELGKQKRWEPTTTEKKPTLRSKRPRLPTRRHPERSRSSGVAKDLTARATYVREEQNT